MLWLFLGCKTPGADSAEPGGHEPATYPLADQLYTTLQATWKALDPPEATKTAISDDELLVTEIDRYAEMGLGVELGPGTTWTVLDDLAPGYEPDDDRASLAYIWQAADPQIIDEESPIRFEPFEQLFRPHGHLAAQTFEASVRTARALSDASGRPFDFALVAGDMTDGSQRNELDWWLTALNGGTIDPDSGDDDDPVAGPGNDFNDPFLSEGLDTPWYAVLGNHDGLYNGGFGVIDEALKAGAVAGEVYDSEIFVNGFRDGADPNAGVVTEGETPPDADREPLTVAELLQALHEAEGEPAGHGLSADDVAAERGYFSVHPMADKPLRLVALQTVDGTKGPAEGSEGWISAEQGVWLEGELAAADAASEVVIVLSHHRAKELSGDSEVDEDALSELLAGSDNVVLHVTGHGHANTRTLYEDASAEQGYWQLMCASTVDFPMQTRIVELVDERDGHLSIYVTNVGHNSPEGSLGHEGRALAGGSLLFPNFYYQSDLQGYLDGQAEQQNVLLRVPIPQDVQDELARHSWSERVESVETLEALEGP